MAMETIQRSISEDQGLEIKRVFELQKSHQYELAATTASERISKLKKIHKAIFEYRDRIREALYNDFRKHPSEVDLVELYPVISEIKHIKSHLRRWMRKQEVDTPLSLMGSNSYIHYEPKGVVLIISPWNFPFQLTFGPLISAIAAGNAVILKPSEYTPHCSSVMKEMITSLFPENEVALFEGSVETSQNLLQLPFNHIFFTGSPQVGKIVMQAAAKHLASVTLELGGKSPTIVDKTANIDMAAKRIAWSKFINNGQICIAPDHVFVHEDKKNDFIERIIKYLKEFYTEDASQEESYSRIVHDRHLERMKLFIEDAVENGAKINYGGKINDADNFVSPTILSDVSMDSKIMQDEIFGPLLPIHSFTDIDEVIKTINDGEIPLALYVYSKNRKNINHIIHSTRAGGSCINHSGVHFYNVHLPFGGSNNSGIGKAGGKYSFEAFSNARGVLKQNIPNALELLVPPYNSFKQKIINLTLKYF
ncbi:MAG: aldehyde dehydrogenase family protein [Bacteroidia bacterium]|nr:aldehyde dehydrogenase family protein [Bacteroidia bacterium]MBT8229035.1 aldehyde dehydrogenase family protein [Bacteroidia bacterium]